ncbi:MAG: HNH endonuclease [Bacteroidetes bacterium]|nr:HNH endonuclease [Bacteroidota bacterium]
MSKSLYKVRKGKLDNLLDKVIGSTREAITERHIRQTKPTLVGKSISSKKAIVGDNGIFLESNGKFYRSYIYLKRSRVKEFGLPKRHYFLCETTEKPYPWVIANQEEVTIFCITEKIYYSDVRLGICGNCAIIFQEKTSQSLFGKSIDEVILTIENNEETQTTQLGMDGYVINWDEISTAYRRIQNFTCEKCRLKITDLNHYHFMHVHHVDLDKSNNNTDNLQCLCIKCHSEVDELHKRNFSTLSNQRIIKRFCEIYL